MQLSRVLLDDETAYRFAKLQQAYGWRSAQRTFDEILRAAWFMITQNAYPPLMTIPEEEPPTHSNLYNFDLVSRQYEMMFVEIKRREVMGGRPSTHADVIGKIVSVVYTYYFS